MPHSAFLLFPFLSRPVNALTHRKLSIYAYKTSGLLYQEKALHDLLYVSTSITIY
ncbi:hypothetical protein BQ1740_4255 [Bacillus subtilis]|nr:hypothetical protein BQ1740_4255 [Bacillus subtilis]